MPKTVDEYLSLPYTRSLRWDQSEGICVARVQELPGCSAHGTTELEALDKLRDNMRDWIGDCLESGEPIPEPENEPELPSGKWLQRVPRTLHLKLNRLAKEEGVSLNQLVASALAETVGSRNRGSQQRPLEEIPCGNVFNSSYYDASCSKGARYNTSYYGWNQHILRAKEIEIDFANEPPLLASPAAAVYVQHLADTVGVLAVDVMRKGRIQYGKGPKPLITAGS